MPQMSPYSWLMLMLLFSMIFIMMTSFIHFVKPNNKIFFKKNLINNKFTLKW